MCYTGSGLEHYYMRDMFDTFYKSHWRAGFMVRLHLTCCVLSHCNCTSGHGVLAASRCLMAGRVRATQILWLGLIVLVLTGNLLVFSVMYLLPAGIWLWGAM